MNMRSYLIFISIYIPAFRKDQSLSCRRNKLKTPKKHLILINSQKRQVAILSKKYYVLFVINVNI